MAHYCDNSKESSSSSNSKVCKSNSDCAGLSTSESQLKLHICPSTGGQWDITVPASETVQGLLRIVARKLKVPRERISLLYRDRVLKEGVLSKHDIHDDCRLTLIPNIESGLLSQRTEQGNVLQALEGLSENQVNDFLAGKSPLTLAMRLGDHMMFVQLQLSTSPAGCKALPAAGISSRASMTNRTSSSSSSVVLPRPLSSTPTSSSSSATLGTPFSPIPGRFAAAGSSHPRNIVPPSVVPAPKAPLSSHKSLAEASKNLSQKLQELTQYHQPPTGAPHRPTSHCHKPSPSPTTKTKEAPASNKKLATNQGAIIESMQHHGRGVYSGTFSGTLNPALQDPAGRPKRNISTIIHILNDLLGATPQCYGASFRPVRREEHVTSVHQKRSAHRVAPSQRLNRTVSDEDKVTRQKMEQLQSMLQQRRQRRKARRLARTSPYAPWGASDKPDEQPLDSPTEPHPPMDLDANMESSNVASNVQDAEKQSYTKLAQQTMVA